MHDGVAPGMEVKSLLADGGGCKDEGPEGRIERDANGLGPTEGLVRVVLEFAETQREVAAHPKRGNLRRPPRAVGAT